MTSRLKTEADLIGPICARFRVPMEESRFLISEGRKVGFILDYGLCPSSTRCFVHAYPTPSSTHDRRTLHEYPGICFLPHGFKVAGIVDGNAYVGEIIYDKQGQRKYVFHLMDGADTAHSSVACTNPSVAFREIQKFSTKPVQRKPTSRLNGKLYIAVTYTATQNLLRERYRSLVRLVPHPVRPIFMEWLGIPDEPETQLMREEDLYTDEFFHILESQSF